MVTSLRLLTAVLGCALPAACTAPQLSGAPAPELRYSIELSVSRNSAAETRGGTVVLGEAGEGVHTMEDSTVRIEIGLPESNDAIPVQIRNKTSSTLRLLWDEVVFIDTDGEGSRVMHIGIRFIERERSMPPRIIPADSTLTDQITPINRVRYEERRYGTWRTETSPLLSRTNLREGARIGLLLPFEVDGQRMEYTMHLTVKPVASDASAETGRPRAQSSTRPTRPVLKLARLSFGAGRSGALPHASFVDRRHRLHELCGREHRQDFPLTVCFFYLGQLANLFE
jgi:hypothetical protein